MKISRFKEYSLQMSMVDDFIIGLDKVIKESDSMIDYKSILAKIAKDLKLNLQLIGTFGTGLSLLYPIVDNLVKNMKLNIEWTPDKIALLTITAFTIIYMEEKSYKLSSKEEILIVDSKSMLEELRLMGIGNGIVKKLVNAFKSIKKLFIIIGRHTGKVISSFVEMFAYTFLLIPVLNGILYIIGKYDLTIDTLIQNLTGLSIGVATIIAKHGISYIFDKIKGKFPKMKKYSTKDFDDDVPPTTIIINDIENIDDGDDNIQDAEIINEQ